MRTGDGHRQGLECHLPIEVTQFQTIPLSIKTRSRSTALEVTWTIQIWDVVGRGASPLLARHSAGIVAPWMDWLTPATEQELVNQWSPAPGLRGPPGEFTLGKPNPARRAEYLRWGGWGRQLDIVWNNNAFYLYPSTICKVNFCIPSHGPCERVYPASLQPPPKHYNWKSTYLQETDVGYHNNTEYI